MMLPRLTLALAALFSLLVGSSAEEMYDIVVEFPHVAGVEHCSAGEMVLIDEAIRQGFMEAGFPGMATTDSWLAWDNGDEINMDDTYTTVVDSSSWLDGFTRKLGGKCDPKRNFCTFMCKKVGTFCHCCPGNCCGGNRRQLRALNGADMADKVDDICDKTMQKAVATGVSCVDTTKPIVTAQKAEVEPVCAGPHEQCGGYGFAGDTCCKLGTTCTYVNEFWSQCVPNPATAECSAEWEQCGGTNNPGGKTCCIEGYNCVELNEWYHQCLFPGFQY